MYYTILHTIPYILFFGISVPHAFINAGLIMGTILTISIGLMTIASLVILTTLARKLKAVRTVYTKIIQYITLSTVCIH
jgi:hypothetical protein